MTLYGKALCELSPSGKSRLLSAFIVTMACWDNFFVFLQVFFGDLGTSLVIVLGV